MLLSATCLFARLLFALIHRSAACSGPIDRGYLLSPEVSSRRRVQLRRPSRGASFLHHRAWILSLLSPPPASAGSRRHLVTRRKGFATCHTQGPVGHGDPRRHMMIGSPSGFSGKRSPYQHG